MNNNTEVNFKSIMFLCHIVFPQGAELPIDAKKASVSSVASVASSTDSMQGVDHDSEAGPADTPSFVVPSISVSFRIMFEGSLVAGLKLRPANNRWSSEDV